ncbi:MAG: sigma-54 dependent transcriptional regulator [Candidatus Hydrogenedentota bacterium]
MIRSVAMSKILIVDDNLEHAQVIAEALGKSGWTVKLATSDFQAFKILDSDNEIALVITDLKLSGHYDGIALMEEARKRYPFLEFLVITGYATVENAVLAMKKGAYDYLTKPLNLDELRLVVSRAMEKQEILLQNIELKQYIEEKYGLENIIGRSESMLKVFKIAKQVAPTNANVLIEGESGTGKELIAKAIHQYSPRKNRLFVALNCAAISEGILESELFGHEKGAFTGAIQRRIGKFEVASGGTLFLDEVGDMPEQTQVKLLRVIEERVIERVGGNLPITVDVRIIAATNQNLEKLVRDGKFREDLYFRLKVVTIVIPPLRERKKDILLLVDYFIKQLSKAHKKDVTGISKDALDIFIRYDWPGNVRQLKNILESMIVIAQKDILDKELIPEEILGDNVIKPDKKYLQNFFGMKLEDVERCLILNTLKETNDNKKETASLLGISERTLYRKLKEYSIKGGDTS